MVDCGLRPIGRGGGGSNPPFDLKKILYAPLNFTVHFLSILPFERGPLVSLLLRITAGQTGLVAATVCEFIHEGPARNARKLFTPLR